MSDTLLSADVPGFGVFGFEAATQWGIFKDGEPVVQAEQVKAFRYSQDWPLSTYQVEDGGFQTYDKVELPFEPKVQFASGGDQATRQALLDSIQAIAGDLNLYDVVTPEAAYLSCNITHCDYERSSERGVGLIRVNVYLVEVRVTATAQFNSSTPLTNTKSPTDADQTNNGTVQSLPNVPPGKALGNTRILPTNFTSGVT